MTCQDHYTLLASGQGAEVTGNTGHVFPSCLGTLGPVWLFATSKSDKGLIHTAPDPEIKGGGVCCSLYEPHRELFPK